MAEYVPLRASPTTDDPDAWDTPLARKDGAKHLNSDPQRYIWTSGKTLSSLRRLKPYPFLDKADTLKVTEKMP